jgi:hypothetical protein
LTYQRKKHDCTLKHKDLIFNPLKYYLHSVKRLLWSLHHEMSPAVFLVTDCDASYELSQELINRTSLLILMIIANLLLVNSYPWSL